MTSVGQVGHEDLWRLYELHVKEYQFQIQLNNQRFQWYTALDVALITIGAGLIRLSDKGAGHLFTSLVFVVGGVLAGFTAIATARQVGYQHAARTQAIKVADELGVRDLAKSEARS